MIEDRIQKKKGLNIFAKIAILLLVPLTLLTVFAVLAAKAVATDVSDTLIQHDLEAGSYGVEQALAMVSDGDYTLTEEKLYKGDVCLTDSDILEKFKEQVELEATLFYGDVRRATSIRGADGNLILGTKAAPEVAEKVLGGETEFLNSIMIEGIEHYGYYEPLKNSDGSIIGMLFIGIQSQIAKASYAKTLSSNIIFLVVICIVAVLAGMWFAVILAKGLAKVVKHLDQVADGDLDLDVDEKLVTRADEIGNVARAIVKAMFSFSTIVKHIIKAAGAVKNLADDFNNRFDFITEAVGNVNIAVTGIAEGATSQANETQNVSEKVSDMGYAIDETRDFVEKLSGNSGKMQEYNTQVQRTIDELADINVQTKNSAQAVYEQTHTTNRSAEEIRTAVDVIADIAGQTNLLSLNASIEAARAGEHGRGFAVVAEEIRTLADQSKESAEMINNVISQLIENSNTSVATIDEMLDIMAKQSEKLKMTSDTFVQLNEEVNEVNEGIVQISDKVLKLDSLKAEVLSGAENLAAIAEENAASTEETAATMTELSQNVDECRNNAVELAEVSNQLTESVSRVKVSE